MLSCALELLLAIFAHSGGLSLCRSDENQTKKLVLQWPRNVRSCQERRQLGVRIIFCNAKKIDAKSEVFMRLVGHEVSSVTQVIFFFSPL